MTHNATYTKKQTTTTTFIQNTRIQMRNFHRRDWIDTRNTKDCICVDSDGKGGRKVPSGKGRG